MPEFRIYLIYMSHKMNHIFNFLWTWLFVHFLFESHELWFVSDAHKMIQQLTGFKCFVFQYIIEEKLQTLFSFNVVFSGFLFSLKSLWKWWNLLFKFLSDYNRVWVFFNDHVSKPKNILILSEDPPSKWVSLYYEQGICWAKQSSFHYLGALKY